MLSLCQNDPPMGESFWQKDSLITHILFELCLFRNLAQCNFFCSPSRQAASRYYLKMTLIIPFKYIDANSLAGIDINLIDSFMSFYI